jgi:hypothetical protein
VVAVAVTLTGAIKGILTGLVPVYRDVAEESAPFPRVVVTEGISTTSALDGDQGDVTCTAAVISSRPACRTTATASSTKPSGSECITARLPEEGSPVSDTNTSAAGDKPVTVYVPDNSEITISVQGGEPWTWQPKNGRVQVDAEDVEVFLAAVPGASLTKES